MFWMGSLIALASALAKSGFIKFVADGAGNAIESAGVSWTLAFLLLILIFVYAHYGFASVSAHGGRSSGFGESMTHVCRKALYCFSTELLCVYVLRLPRHHHIIKSV